MKWNVHNYNQHTPFVAEYGIDLIRILAPQAGESILDLGCGDGVLTQKLVVAGAHITAIDASPDMIAAAKEKGLNAHIGAGQNMAYEQEFDAVFSNAALHWMRPADKVARNIYKALKQGGRFCAEFGGAGNVGLICKALYSELAARGLNGDDYNPWYFPSLMDYQNLLEETGFTLKQIEAYDRPTPLPTNVKGWLITFAEPFLKDLATADHDQFLDAVMARVRPQLCDEKGCWFADYKRLRLLAYK